ncbi:MAG: cysteine desulfurase [Clostridia bacterium]|nr:cysteine desulfurase [Clostridia bacterium]
MGDIIYLDNSATTPIHNNVRERMLSVMDCFYNPSSVHKGGLEARALIENARNEVFAAFDIPKIKRIDNALPVGSGAIDGWRLIFTSSGTESDNLAITGVLNAKQFKEPPHFVTTDSEHPAVLATLKRLELQKKITLSVLSTLNGEISLDQLKETINKNTLFLSIMTVNNETGARYDIEGAFALAKKNNPDIITHTDAVQGFLNVPVNWRNIGCDMVTVSGHKIGAPKGVGALLVSNKILRSKRLSPLVTGGGQEGGLRSGTENVIGISAMGMASQIHAEGMDFYYSRMQTLRDLFKSCVGSSVRINEAKNYAPHIISVTLPGIKSETMLHFLSEKGIYVSAGSACSSRNEHVSAALSSFGLPDREATSTIRISMGRQNSTDDIITTAQAILYGIETLSKQQR